MNRIFIDQSNLRITAETGVTVAGATSQFIKYKRPDGIIGSWVGIADGEDVYYNFSEPSELSQSGYWTFWAYVVFSDGRTAPGNSTTIYVYKEGERPITI